MVDEHAAASASDQAHTPTHPRRAYSTTMTAYISCSNLSWGAAQARRRASGSASASETEAEPAGLEGLGGRGGEGRDGARSPGVGGRVGLSPLPLLALLLALRDAAIATIAAPRDARSTSAWEVNTSASNTAARSGAIAALWCELCQADTYLRSLDTRSTRDTLSRGARRDTSRASWSTWLSRTHLGVSESRVCRPPRVGPQVAKLLHHGAVLEARRAGVCRRGGVRAAPSVSSPPSRLTTPRDPPHKRKALIIMPHPAAGRQNSSKVRKYIPLAVGVLVPHELTRSRRVGVGEHCNGAGANELGQPGVGGGRERGVVDVLGVQDYQVPCARGECEAHREGRGEDWCGCERPKRGAGLHGKTRARARPKRSRQKGPTCPSASAAPTTWQSGSVPQNDDVRARSCAVLAPARCRSREVRNSPSGAGSGSVLALLGRLNKSAMGTSGRFCALRARCGSSRASLLPAMKLFGRESEVGCGTAPLIVVTAPRSACCASRWIVLSALL